MKRVALAYSPHGQVRAFGWSVHLNRFKRICRAGRQKPAGRGLKRRNKLAIETDRRLQGLARYAHWSPDSDDSDAEPSARPFTSKSPDTSQPNRTRAFRNFIIRSPLRSIRRITSSVILKKNPPAKPSFLLNMPETRTLVKQPAMWASP
jgi:hypothetical protein